MGAIPRQIKICEKICSKHKDKDKLSPIFGVELYVNDLQIGYTDKEELSKYSKDLDPNETDSFRASPHLLAIATSLTGYKNLVKLTSWGWTRGFYRKPRVNYEQLMNHKEGIIFTSCCYNSEVGRAFDKGGEEAGYKVIEKYVSMFGKENYYLEIMLLDFKKQFEYNKFIIKAHEKYKLPIILSQDVHYCNKEDSYHQRLMLMIQTKRTLKMIKEEKEKDAMKDFFELQDENLWMKSEEELNEKWLKDYSEIIPYEIFCEAKRTTVKVCERAKGVEFDRSLKLPIVDDCDEKLKESIKLGFIARGLPKNSRYLDRIKEEYSLITRKGFSSYFLIQKMMTDEARRICPQILGGGDGSEAVGPGRGCLEGNTLILIENGFYKPISEIKVGDKVCTRDGSFQEVLNTFEYPCNEDLLTIYSYYGDNRGVSLTRDHKVLVEKSKKVENYKNWAESTKKSRKSIEEPSGTLDWIRADQISVGDWVFIPQLKLNNSELPDIDLSKYCNGENLLFDKDFVFQDYINPLTKTIKRNKKCKRFIDINNKDFWTIVGLFAGDGWIRSDGRGEIGFAFHEDDHVGLKLVTKFATNLCVEYSIFKHKKKKLKQLSIKSKFLYHLFREMYNSYHFTSQTKHIPEIVFSLPDTFKWAFIKGYFMADGHLSENKISFDSVSLNYVSQIRTLLLSLGVPSSCNYMDRLDKRNNQKYFCYKVNIPVVKELSEKPSCKRYTYRKVDGGFLVKVRKISELKNVKRVYDFEVKNNSNYLTSSFLVHNSAVGSLVCYCLGITDVDPIKEDLLFSRFLSESRGGRSMILEFKDD